MTDQSCDESTTALVRVHTHIGRDGVIVELRREGWDFPNESDMKHLSDEKVQQLYDQLGVYLSDNE